MRGSAAHAHVEDERAREGGERRPVERGLRLGGVLVAGDERDAAGQVAVGDGDAGVGGRGHAGGDAGHDLERRSPASRSTSASSPPRPNTNGSPPLRRTTRRPARRVLDQQPVASPPAGTAGRRPACRRRRAPRPSRAWASAVGRDQAVVEDHVGGRDQLDGAHGQQAGVAGPRADEVDDAAHAPSPRRRAAASPAPAASMPARASSSPSPPTSSSAPTPMPSGRPAKPRICNDICDELRMNAHGSVTTRADARDRGPFRRQACHRGRMAHGGGGIGGRGPGPGLDRDHALPGGGHEHLAAQRAARLVARGRAARARRRRARARRPRRRRSLRSRVSTLPRSSRDLEVGPRGEQLGATPQRAGADARALAHRVERVLADQHVERVGAARRGDDGRCPPPARRARPWPSAPRGRCRRPAARASSAPVQRDLSPRARSTSPAVVISTSSVSPRRARSATARAWASASRLPRVPMRSGASTRPQRADLGGAAASASALGRPSSSPNSSRSSCSRAWRCSASSPFTRAVGSCSSRLHDRAGERLDALAVGARPSASQRPAFSASRPSTTASPRARSAASVGSTSS